jgi:hypothetical protein
MKLKSFSKKKTRSFKQQNNLNLSAVISNRKNNLDTSFKPKKFSMMSKHARNTKRKFKSNENLSYSFTRNSVKNGKSNHSNQYKFYQKFKKTHLVAGKRGKKSAKLSNTFD